MPTAEEEWRLLTTPHTDARGPEVPLSTQGLASPAAFIVAEGSLDLSTQHLGAPLHYHGHPSFCRTGKHTGNTASGNRERKGQEGGGAWYWDPSGRQTQLGWGGVAAWRSQRRADQV